MPGAWEVTPVVHADARGAFFEWFTDAGFTAFAGHRFDLRQANCSVSAAGVLRGVHFAQVPPGQAKYVTCMRGAVFDVVVDIRVGSPTFGRWDAVTLDDASHRSVYLAEGLGHAFLALEDDSTVVLPVLGGLRPGPRAHHQRTGSGDRTSRGRCPAASSSCPIAIARRRLSSRRAPTGCCPTRGTPATFAD